MPRILVIEPYFGGSHKQFLDGIQEHIAADFIFLTLPARKWKMRMQLSAPWFVEHVKKMANKNYTTVLSSTFVDVAVLKALLSGLPEWNSNCRFCTYFHENQFVYPLRDDEKTRFQFTSINFTTALVSDRIAFNSHYNKESFLNSCARYLKKNNEIDLSESFVEIEEKSSVIYPGIQLVSPQNVETKKNEIAVICWNHRWEHDKNPDEFFDTLERLDEMGYDFRLVVLGQSFRYEPPVFAWAYQRFKDKILQFGYVESRQEYLDWLSKSDIVVSTAYHEFFGIAVIEAVHGGCLPVVPNRLSYPELYPRECRYNKGELLNKLGDLIAQFSRNELPECSVDTEKFDWSALQEKYHRWLLD